MKSLFYQLLNLKGVGKLVQIHSRYYPTLRPTPPRSNPHFGPVPLKQSYHLEKIEDLHEGGHLSNKYRHTKKNVRRRTMHWAWTQFLNLSHLQYMFATQYALINFCFQCKPPCIRYI